VVGDEDRLLGREVRRRKQDESRNVFHAEDADNYRDGGEPPLVGMWG
jgi:hypothetical protein